MAIKLMSITLIISKNPSLREEKHQIYPSMRELFAKISPSLRDFSLINHSMRIFYCNFAPEKERTTKQWY